MHDEYVGYLGPVELRAVVPRPDDALVDDRGRRPPLVADLLVAALKRRKLRWRTYGC